MRFGIAYNIDYHEEIHGSPASYFAHILDECVRLEELGYDTVWFAEHHAAGYSFGNPAVIAAAVAARTSRIRIGVGVSLLPLHHPIEIAEEYGMVDAISGGRLDFGIGRGYMEKEYRWFGIPYEESNSRYREAADFIVAAWTSNGEPMDFAGKHFQVDGYRYFPKPAKSPHPPIYASAGGSVGSFQWAGEKGLNLGTPLFLPDLDEVARNVGLYRETLAANGFDPASREVCAITQMYCAADNDEAVRDGSLYATNYYRFFSDLSGGDGFFQTARGEDMNQGDHAFFGNPENLIPRLQHMQGRMGIDLMLFEVAQGKAPPEKVQNAVTLFAKEVMPAFQTNAAASEAA
jgi:alkanesulfonate monooxygenase SsuD/methylene tetrahydromethanopterin reductase-like flavin-dependent oxidoreductase (luciferase family)